MVFTPMTIAQRAFQQQQDQDEATIFSQVDDHSSVMHMDGASWLPSELS